jgi:hypothetical protein
MTLLFEPPWSEELAATQARALGVRANEGRGLGLRDARRETDAGRVAGVHADPRLGQRLPILRGTTNDFPPAAGGEPAFVARKSGPP